MDVHAGAGASYDPATAIFDDVAASQRTPWPYDMAPKDLLIVRRSHQDICSHCHVEMVQPVQDAGELVQGSLLVPDPLRVNTRNAMLNVQSDQALQPPRDPERRRAYYATLNKAQRVQRTNPRQASVLEQRARGMMESVDGGRAEATRRGVGRTSPNPPRMTIHGDSHERLAELEQVLRRVRQQHGTRMRTSPQVLEFPDHVSRDRDRAA